MFLVSSCSCLCPIHGSHVVSREWRCSWSNGDRRCSKHIWVITILLPSNVWLVLEVWRYIRFLSTHILLMIIWKRFPYYYDDVNKCKHFPPYWPFVRGIHRSPMNSPHKDQWRGAAMFSLICVWINGWVNNREAGDLRRYRPLVTSL